MGNSSTNEEEGIIDHFFDLIKDGKLNSVSKMMNEDIISINVQKMSYDKRTPIFQACDFRQFEIIQFFLKNKGVDINATNEFGWTPLHVAAFNGYYEIVILLLQNGADKDIKNMLGETAEEKSLYNFSEIFKLSQEEIMKIDLKAEYELLVALRRDYEKFITIYPDLRHKNKGFENARNISWLLECIYNESIIEQLLLTQYLIDIIGVDTQIKDRYGRLICEHTYFSQQRTPVQQILGGVRLKDYYLQKREKQKLEKLREDFSESDFESDEETETENENENIQTPIPKKETQFAQSTQEAEQLGLAF